MHRQRIRFLLLIRTPTDRSGWKLKDAKKCVCVRSRHSCKNGEELFRYTLDLTDELSDLLRRASFDEVEPFERAGRIKPERWLSGRKHFIANEATGSNWSAGSNPVLSAFFFFLDRIRPFSRNAATTLCRFVPRFLDPPQFLGVEVNAGRGAFLDAGRRD